MEELVSLLLPPVLFAYLTAQVLTGIGVYTEAAWIIAIFVGVYTFVKCAS